MEQKRTVVINLFAGPGAGKTTCAWGIASELKRLGLDVEYVPEFAKELVWDNDLEKLRDQRYLFEMQNHRVERLLGKVDFIVTDSPLLLNIIYDQDHNTELYREVIEKHNAHLSLNFFIKRGQEFEATGRIHNLEQSIAIDKSIKNLLQQEHVVYNDISHADYIDVICQQVSLLQQPPLTESVIKDGGIKMFNKNFIDDCVNGNAQLLDLDKYVEYWHTHETNNTLREFLGLTDSEYTLWGKSDDSIFGDFIKSRTVTSVNKQRLFVDMDGTLATFTPVERLETLYEKGYFLNLRPMDNVVLAVKEIIQNNPEVEVSILSAYLSDSRYALEEKNKWLDRYLPEIDAAHRIFPPCGTDKKEYIPNGIRPTDCLLDDYTHNLTLWQPPARGIKLLNGINHTKGTWKYDCIRYDQIPKELAAQIDGMMKGSERVPGEAPQKPAVPKLTVNQFAKNIRQQLEAANQESGALIDLLKAKLNMPNMRPEGIAAIKLQRPDARCVKSLQEWRKEGYHLKPGEFAKGIMLLTSFREQCFQRDGKEVNVMDATPDEKQQILSGKLEVKETVIDKMQMVYDITQTNCASVDYSRVMLPIYKFVAVPVTYNILKANINKTGVPVTETAMPVLSVQGYYDKDKGEIFINNSLKDYQQLAALCDTYGVFLIDKTSTQTAEVKAFESSYVSIMLKSALALPVDDAEIKNVTRLYTEIPGHSIDTLDSSLTRCQRANTKTMAEIDNGYQAFMQSQGIKLDMTRQDSVSQNFLQDLS